MTECSPPTTYHMSHVMCHMSHVMCHMLNVTCRVSHVMCHMSQFFSFVSRQSGEAYRGGTVINGAYPV